jgi:nitroreductase
MEVFEAIHGRRSVRAYTGEPVDDARIRRLLQAAVQAPSATNAQPWSFAVVQDQATLRRYSDRGKRLLLARSGGDPTAGRYRQMLENPEFDIFYAAGTLIVICARPDSTWAQADCWLAAQNLQLAAHALGLGTCCIGFALGILNEPDVKGELGIPADVAAIAPLIVGTPRALPPPVPRAEPVIRGWIRPH